MPATTDNAKDATTEAVKIAQEAARRYLDESLAINASYLNAWTASANAALRSSFEMQNAGLQAWRTVFEAGLQANRSLFDQTIELVRKNQDVTAKIVATGIGLAESAFPRGRTEREQ
jgi:hypothetical protein